MRTARYVTLLFLVSMCGAGFAQEKADEPSASIDRDITVIGRDETALPIPAPWTQAEIDIPELDPAQPSSPTLPPILPPPGDWPSPAADQRAIAPSGELNP
jgi:hypothetical protein